ncbi:MAG: dienelactone hydrolase family protein [Rhodanobacter sp.]|jgi:predicted dienelactone hydrolase
MKWLKFSAFSLMVLAAAVAVLVIGTARRPANPVGFQTARVETPSGAVAVALWYPTSATPRPTTFINGSFLSLAPNGPVEGHGLPVIVLSHGNGGSAFSHVDLAMELASAGYVVAAPTHGGDNVADQSRQGDPAIFSQRAGQIRATIDYVRSSWAGAAHVDPERVGAFGFSAGAFTVLGLVGGVPDMALVVDHCRRQPEFVCTALAHARSPLLAGTAAAGRFTADERIKAAVVAAPGLGFTFERGGLGRVRVPVQVWSGSHDTTVPFESNTRVVQAGLGEHGEARQLRGANHLSFLAPCGLLRPPAVCSDPDGFDRESAHRAMNTEIISFFNAKLAPAREGPTP